LPGKIEREFANIVGGAGPNGALGVFQAAKRHSQFACRAWNQEAHVLGEKGEKQEEVDRSASEFVVFLSRESGSPVGLSRRTGRSRDSNWNSLLESDSYRLTSASNTSID